MADASFFPGYDDAGVTSVGAEDSVVVMASVDGVESGMLAASVGVTVVVAAGAVVVVVVVELGMKDTA